VATNKYGASKRYKIPVLRPTAALLRPLLIVLSTADRHIAHWENDTELDSKRSKIIGKTILILFIFDFVFNNTG
jgi:hypothetical protein